MKQFPVRLFLVHRGEWCDKNGICGFHLSVNGIRGEVVYPTVEIKDFLVCKIRGVKERNGAKNFYHKNI